MIGTNELQAKKTISHLQNQIKNGRPDNKENLRSNENNVMFQLEEKKEINRENKENINQKNYDKNIYLEGALWMSI